MRSFRRYLPSVTHDHFRDIRHCTSQNNYKRQLYIKSIHLLSEVARISVMMSVENTGTYIQWRLQQGFNTSDNTIIRMGMVINGANASIE